MNGKEIKGKQRSLAFNMERDVGNKLRRNDWHCGRPNTNRQLKLSACNELDIKNRTSEREHVRVSVPHQLILVPSKSHPVTMAVLGAACWRICHHPPEFTAMFSVSGDGYNPELLAVLSPHCDFCHGGAT